MKQIYDTEMNRRNKNDVDIDSFYAYQTSMLEFCNEFKRVEGIIPNVNFELFFKLLTVLNDFYNRLSI